MLTLFIVGISYLLIMTNMDPCIVLATPAHHPSYKYSALPLALAVSGLYFNNVIIAAYFLLLLLKLLISFKLLASSHLLST